MPEDFRSINKLCEVCSKSLILRNTRDIKRKRFCSRKCLGLWLVKTGKLVGPNEMTFETRQKMRESKLRLLELGWKPTGWKKYDTPVHYNAHHGYLFKGIKRLHRILAEQKIGRPLIRGEVVHHLNGDKLNNNLENLVVMARSEHTKMHTERRKAYAFGVR